MMTDLDYARAQIMTLIAVNNVALPITDDAGQKNVVIALAEEKLTDLTQRLNKVNGYANLFVKNEHRIHVVSVVNAQCALVEDKEPLTTYGDSESTVGMFIDYLGQKNGPVGLRSASGMKPFARAEGQEPLVAA